MICRFSNAIVLLRNVVFYECIFEVIINIKVANRPEGKTVLFDKPVHEFSELSRHI